MNHRMRVGRSAVHLCRVATQIDATGILISELIRPLFLTSSNHRSIKTAASNPMHMLLKWLLTQDPIG